MQIKAAVKNFFTANWRQKLTLLSSGFIVYFILLTGIFSYFHSEDTVTNRLDAKSGSVTVHEPAWDKEGQKMAQASEPGMKIPKNPFGTNDGQVDEYIRLKMTIETVNQTEYNTKCTLPYTAAIDGEITKKSEAERLTAIVNAIQYIDGSSIEPFLTLDSSQAIMKCANPKFYAVPENKSTESNKLTYYFYYTAGDKDSSGADLMRRVAPNHSTDELFRRVDIPKYKKDYLGVFDFDYSITLTAEAIPVGNDTIMTVSEAIDKF